MKINGSIVLVVAAFFTVTTQALPTDLSPSGVIARCGLTAPDSADVIARVEILAYVPSTTLSHITHCVDPLSVSRTNIEAAKRCCTAWCG